MVPEKIIGFFILNMERAVSHGKFFFYADQGFFWKKLC